ncbi:MAG: patatin-like protein [Sphingomonadaceae bacterium]
MREKELRLALICYGGISLAVYMHGITKEIWHLASASRAFHAGDEPGSPARAVYHDLLAYLRSRHAVELRVLTDILAGASAGGLNAIYLAEAISSGCSLEPLTELWLEGADVDRLIDPETNAIARFAKAAAVPVAWALSERGDAIDETVEPAHRAEFRAKIARFVRARWFAPPFGGELFTNMLLDAFDAMAAAPRSPPLLPDYQPLDLFVTVTDFRGHPESLRLHSPAIVAETEHRLILSFRDRGGPHQRLADRAELAFAGRATASFPGAFPPFQVAELDGVLAARAESWPGRERFLKRILPRQAARGRAGETVLIDGSVLANAPFRPAIEALENRPARREVDRRFVYIDPKPGNRNLRLQHREGADPPGFFATIFGALSDIPRAQPIRDNLESIERRSARIRRLRRIIRALRPDVEAAIGRAFGRTLLLARPTPQRLANWRGRAQKAAASEAGFAFAAYQQLKYAAVVEDSAGIIQRIAESDGGRAGFDRLRDAIFSLLRSEGLDGQLAVHSPDGEARVITFQRGFDLAYRTRRLRFLGREINEMNEEGAASAARCEQARKAVYGLIGDYRAALAPENVPPATRAAFRDAERDPEAAMRALAELLGLKELDRRADRGITRAIAGFEKRERRRLMLTYLGFPFYDIATLALLQGEGLDEFDAIKVDRIAPEDATAIREGGAEATLKGIQLNNFGAFFSRAFRENDYLWGRLHGADRLIDIVISTLAEHNRPPPGAVAAMKRRAFRAILEEERPRLGEVGALIDSLAAEIAPADPSQSSEAAP